MTLKINLEWDADDQVWTSNVPDVGGISTYGETLEEAVKQTREAILGYLDTAGEQRLHVPGHADLLRAVCLRNVTP